MIFYLEKQIYELLDAGKILASNNSHRNECWFFFKMNNCYNIKMYKGYTFINNADDSHFTSRGIHYLVELKKEITILDSLCDIEQYITLKELVD